MLKYKTMLDRAYKHITLDQEKDKGESFSLEVESLNNKSIVKGIDYFVKRWDRDIEDIFVFFKKSLGTGGKVENKNIILFCNCNIDKVKRMLITYKTNYVICPICKSHHTVIENNIKKCLVCGNWQENR